MLPAPKIIFEDDWLLIIDKPAGWIVNCAETAKGEAIIQDWVSERYSGKDVFRGEGDFFHRCGIVHRLDRETSGILVVAKTTDAFSDLQRQFKTRLVKKKYLALVHGRLNPDRGTIDLPISRSPFNRKKFGVFPGGRVAKTDYSVIASYSSAGDDFSLLEVFPLTGRTHQIRVHLKHIGHPVVADEKYAGRKMARKDRKFCPRQFLHAASLSLEHPNTRQCLVFESPLPEDLAGVISGLVKIS